MKRYVPPLLVLAILAAVLLRTLGRPAAEADQERVRTTWSELASQDRGRALTRAYAKAHTREEDRRFVLESWARLGDLDEALQVMFGPSIANVSNEDARAFAEIVLPALGWHDRARSLPRPWALAVEAALTEARVPWMVEAVTERASTGPVEPSALLMRRASRFGNRTPIDLVLGALREREDLEGREAKYVRFLSAVATYGFPGATWHPEDRAFLLDVLKQQRLVDSGGWAECVLALGRSADPELLAILRAERLALVRTDGEREARDAAILNAGLWAGGDAAAEKRARQWAQDAALDTRLLEMYTEAGLHRYLLGDERARRILGRVWETFGEESKGVRYHIANRLMFQEAPPLEGEPAEKMLRDLDVDSNPAGRVLGAAYRLRLGREDAATQVLQALQGSLRFGAPIGELTDAWVFGLRALLLYT